MGNNIFSNINDKEFLENFYQREVARGSAGKIGQRIADILFDIKKFLQDLGPSISEDLFLFSNGLGCKRSVYFDSERNLIHWDNIWQMYSSEGITIYLRGLQKYSTEIATILNSLHPLFENRRFFANVFLSPPGSSGLNAHFDPTEFLIFQISGSKKWCIWNAPPSKVAESLYPKEMAEYCENVVNTDAPIYTINLCANEVLYMPLYWIHAPKTLELPSCHITIGLAHPELRGIKDEKNGA